MNDEIMKEKLTKTRKQIDISAQIYEHALAVATRIVDEHLPYQEQIDLAKLPGEKYDRITERQEAISIIVANLLQLSECVRL